VPARTPLVLVVDDDEWSSRALETVLEPAGFESLRAYSGEQAIERAATRSPDAILLDIGLPDMSGLEVCRRLRDDPNIGARTAILLTTVDPISRQRRLEAYEAGAWDVFHLPTDADALVLRLRSYANAKQEADRAIAESLLDAPTGLYNLRGLVRRANEMAAEARRWQKPLACVVFGPSVAGRDETSERHTLESMLHHVAAALRKSCRASDVIGRMGPEQVALLALDTDPRGAEALAERMLRVIERAADEPEDDDESEPDAPIKIRVGYHAESDLRGPRVDATALLERAALAWRAIHASGNGNRILSYDAAAQGARATVEPPEDLRRPSTDA
ncbi:MAG: response regulator, partial [Gemmatimonadota bacterium]